MRNLTLFLISLLLITACSSSDGGDDPSTPTSAFDRGVMLEHWANNIIIPAYQNLHSANEELENVIEEFVQDPRSETLEAARSAHRNAYIAWQKVAFHEVGPAKNENLRLYFNNYPVNVAMTVELAMQSDYDLHLPSNASSQGYPAIDYLLNGLSNNDQEIIDTFTIDENSTQYGNFLNALAERLAQKSSLVKNAWENGYRDSFIQNDGSSASASVDLIANDFLLYYEKYFRNGKVRFPVGYTSGNAIPENVESYYYPTLSKELFLTSNNAMRDFFEGKNFDGSGSGNSFKSYLNSLNKQDVSEEIISKFNTISSTANSIDLTFKDAVVEDRTSMLNLHDRIQENVIPMKVDMMQALNISVAYFDGDGD